MSVQTQQPCLYRQEGAMHIFTYTEASRSAVDAYMAHLREVLKTTPPHTKLIRILTDSSQCPKAQPLVYMMTQLREIDKNYPQRPLVRNASLFDGGVISSITDSLFSTFSRRDKFRVFKPSQREQAVAWLMQEE